MDKHRKKFPVVVFLIFGIIAVSFLGWYIKSEITSLKNQQYKTQSLKLKQELAQLIEAKKTSSLAIAISLSQDLYLKNVLKGTTDDVDLAKNFKLVSAKLRKYTDYKNVWIQIINKKGVSLVRSWRKKKPDPLANVRADLKEMIEDPKVMSTTSVGKFSMAFKSMVPIFDDESKEFLGVIETVTHFNSIVKELQKVDTSSLILADKRYKDQLTKAITKKFINGYYVVNFDIDQEKTDMLEQAGIENFLHTSDFTIYKNFLITTYIIKDIYNQDMGYYILMKDLDSFHYKNIDNFLNNIAIIAFIGFVLTMIIIFTLYKRKHDIERQKMYYQDILDSSSDMIVISDTNELIDVNKAFFDFFDEYKTLYEFTKKHGCLCNFFEEEEGFLHKQMGEYSWIEYAYMHNTAEHKVKIMHKGRPYYFSMRIKELINSTQKLYTIVLTDITKMKIYQDELEHLSQTDTLTNIGNREYFKQSIPKEMDRAKRYKHNLSLIMLDIDFFKNINDTYGHDIGDIALVKMTQTVQDLLRRTDIFCRYGGEEFMILLPESSTMETAILAERIRAHVEKMHISPIEKMTISIGLTEMHNDDTVESFIKRVDKALYRSKNEGRNRITSE